MTKRNVMAWMWIGCASLAGGCGAARPIQYYQLTVPGDVAAMDGNANAYPVSLLVGPLSASHLYREEYIVYSSGGESMGTYQSHRWTEPPTEMMQEVLFRELRASGKYKTVNSLRSSARGDYAVQGRLYDFKEVEGNGLLARVAVEYELRDLKSGTTVWSHYYSHDEPVGGKEISAVVAALDRNVQGIVGQVKVGLDGYFAGHPVGATAQ
jgi:ABC-type uncharacterized transport system auxiliary subunit